MLEIIGYILLIALYIAITAIAIGVFVAVLAGSLFIGAVGGLFIGIYRGFKNYFEALSFNLNYTGRWE